LLELVALGISPGACTESCIHGRRRLP
jgi:hypothetical protein